MDIKELIISLSDAVGIGNIDSATKLARQELSKYAEVKDFGQIGLVATINKGKDKTIMLEAHIDEVGFIVTSVFPDGFLKVTKVGGNDHRFLPATSVTVHGKTDIPAVFASTPPHLAKLKSGVKDTTDILLDTGLDEKAPECISVGDFVTYDKKCMTLAGGRRSGKSLDDRAGVACLIETASRVYNKELPCNLIICLSEAEELGTRGAKTAAFANFADEAIAIDVSFADAPDVPATKCGKLGKGAMIGISPVLNKKVTDKLLKVAKENNIPYSAEVMGGATGTDADVISVTREGIPSGLISIPLRNMHTPVEVIDIKDIVGVCDILEAYILSGGAK